MLHVDQTKIVKTNIEIANFDGGHLTFRPDTDLINSNFTDASSKLKLPFMCATD